MGHQSQIPAIKLPDQISGLNIGETLRWLAITYPGRVGFSTSFGIEDQVITHFITSENLSIDIFTLDTGRLFPETYSVWSETNKQYQTNIHSYFPDNVALEK